MKHIHITLAFAAIIAGLNAQTDPTTEPVDEKVYELADTVVTGGLWESDLQQATASVTVFDEERLQDNGVFHFEDIINAIPNVTWTGGSSRPRFIQIRGIGENSQFEGETPDSAVRFLMDDLDLTGLGGVGNLFDVQQVEVLRGPQAGAFGANAAGGVIKIVTNEPTPYWTGQTEFTVGQDSLFAEGIAVGGGLIQSDPEKLTFRLALHQLNQDGFRDNRYTGDNDTNKRDEFTSRLKVRWLANEDWQWDGTLLYADFNNGYDEWSLDNRRSNTYSDEPGEDDQTTWAGSIRGIWDGLDNARLTSITGYSDTDSTYSYDSDWTNDIDLPGNYHGFMKVDRDRDTFSQELRLDSKEQEDALGWIDRWTIGGYFSTLSEDSKTNYSDIWTGQPGDQYYYPVYAKTNYDSDNYSLFGQVAHDFSPDTRLILGLRTEYYDIDVKSHGEYYGAPNSGKDHKSDTLFGGKITLEHDLTPEQMIFGSITRGYKAGGANIATFVDTTAGDPLTYDDETLYNFETGLRSEWFDAAVLSQVTAFYLYRDDPQLRDSGGSGGFFNYYTDNGSHAEHYGLEAEATWFITRNWTASAGLGLLQTENDDNKDLANAPAYTFNASLSYQAENGFFATLEANGSDQYYESNNKDNRSERVRNAFVTFNGSIGYKYQNWTFTVWGKNLFDEKYEERVYYFANIGPDFDDPQRYEDPADPQQFGMTVNYRW